MEGLGFDNIFGEDEINNLFIDNEESSTEETVEEPASKENDEADTVENDETNKTTEVDPEDLFGEEEQKEKPESVGSEKEEVQGKEGSSTEDGGGTSPNKNFYSSIANAMAEDGIFPNLDEETLGKVVDAETFSNAIEAEIAARLDETQLRISKALNNGVEPSDIRMYETTLNNLASIKDTDIEAESEKGETLRYQLITQDYLNKGISRDKADKMARRSINDGNDIEDAKEALQSNRDYFQKAYDKLLEDAQKAAEIDRANRQKESDKLRDSILKDKTLMGDMEISADLRKKAFDNISKAAYKDPESGEYLTNLQKYELEHKAEFLKYVGLFYTLTNGFKDFDSLAKGKVKKELKKGLSELEKTLNGTSRNANGSLKMVTSVKDDPESYIGKGFKLDI